MYEPLADGAAPAPAPRKGMTRGRLTALLVGAAVLAGAVVSLRSGVEAPPDPVTAPNGEQIRAFHDTRLVDPPRRPADDPQQPGTVRVDDRRGGALVTWPPAPFGFEVRWGRAGGPLDGVRYLATAGTSLFDLDPGGYRVEVRSVDEVGRRSEPSVADFEVRDEAPDWQRGLGFAEDFTAGGDLDPTRWIVPDEARRCLRRAGPGGPVVLPGRECYPVLEPASPVVLSEPDDQGVRARVVVVADTPPPVQEGGRPEGLSGDNQLLITVGDELEIGGRSVTLQISGRGAVLHTAQTWFRGEESGHRLDAAAVGTPGALRRWELVFTADELLVLMNGDRVGSTPFRTEWTEAKLHVHSQILPDGGRDIGTRIGFIGFTGREPTGGPVQLAQQRFRDYQPTTELRVPVTGRQHAESVLLRAVVTNHGTDPQALQVHPEAPKLTGELAGVPVEVRIRSNGVDFDPDERFAPTHWMEVELTGDAVRAAGELVLRSADGQLFGIFQVDHLIRYPKGTDPRVPRLEERPADLWPTMPRPSVTIRRDGQLVNPHERLAPGRLEVEVDVESVTAQGVGGSLIGWVALRVTLDGRRILDHPTATAGSAFTGRYTFTLDTESLRGRSADLEVTLLPDREGVRPSTREVSVRVNR